MRNKGLLLVAAALVLVFGQLSFGQSTSTSSSAVAAPPNTSTIRERQDHQQDRIAAGLKDGQLTKQQAGHLERNERRVNREARDMAAANGGKLNARDRAKLNRQENRTSKKIYRGRH